MRESEKFREYIWLVERISEGPKSLIELNELWLKEEMSGGVEMSRSTFLRHKDAIEEMFGLYIECDRHNGYRYYIGNEYVLHEESVQTWLLSSISVSSLVSSCLSMQHRILLEQAAVDRGLLQQITGAMKTGRRLRISYRPYGGKSAREHVVEPYCIKQRDRRWYLLGRKGKGGFTIYSFDRMERLIVLAERFEIDRNFDADVFFSEFYGVVIGDNTPVERIRVRAFGWERFSMQDRPLHHTQQLIAEGDDYCDFELVLRPTSDFKSHVLGRGRWLRVLSPGWLAADIRQQHLEAALE